MTVSGERRLVMKQDYTHITVILDRTGSMESIRDDTIGGFNAFLGRQKVEPGTATLTLVQFDSQDPYEVIYRFRPIDEIPELTRETYVPRASTPLLDALGRGINDLEKSLTELDEDARPSKIILVVVTDGHENSSREFTKSQIEKMVKEKSDKEDWQFVFLSADLAAFDDAMSVGIYVESFLAYEKTDQGSASAWASLADRTADFRAERRRRVNFDEVDRRHPDDPARNR
jgi:hypothetical protein